MDFSDRFELLELLREDKLHQESVQTFRTRERATGRAFEAHFASSPDALSGVQAVIDQGSHEGKFYVVTAALDSAGAWRIQPPVQPAAGAAPGDFTRMFQLRQAPEPLAVPVSKPMPDQAAASSPGAFTRAFEKPAAAPSAAPVAVPAPGEIGEFTRMFQQPAVSAPVQPEPSRPSRMLLIVIAIAVLSAIAVFVLVRRLY